LAKARVFRDGYGAVVARLVRISSLSVLLNCSISYYFTDVLSAEFAFSSAASAAAISGQLATLSRAVHGARSIRRFE